MTEFSYYTLKKFLDNKTFEFIQELSQADVLPGCKFTHEQCLLLEGAYDTAVDLALKRLLRTDPSVSFRDKDLMDMIEAHCDICDVDNAEGCDDMNCKLFQAGSKLDKFESKSYFELEDALYDICDDCQDGPLCWCSAEKCPITDFLEGIKDAILEWGM